MKNIFLIYLILILIKSDFAFAKKETPPKYRTYFGTCPSRSAGKLSLKTMEVFENKKSLKDVKEAYIRDGLAEKYFLSSYKIDYHPQQNFLTISFECPKPLMKVQVYKEDGAESYSAILVEGGKLLDPSYEILLRSEGKLNIELPFFALPLKDIDSFNQEQMAKSLSVIPKEKKSLLSEVIIDEKGDLLFILSYQDNPISAFLGKDEWDLKIKKLFKMVDYFDQHKKIPTIVNLTNPKKVVVKFSDKF
jgi:hypothetical protein